MMPEVKFKIDDNGNGLFYLIDKDVQVGEMQFAVREDHLIVYHTEVNPEENGKGYALLLMVEMIKYVRENNLSLKPLCPFVKMQLKRHPEKYADIRLR